MKKNMYAQLSSAEEKSKISAITLGTEIVSQKYLNIFYLPYTVGAWIHNLNKNLLLLNSTTAVREMRWKVAFWIYHTFLGLEKNGCLTRMRTKVLKEKQEVQVGLPVIMVVWSG